MNIFSNLNAQIALAWKFYGEMYFINPYMYGFYHFLQLWRSSCFHL